METQSSTANVISDDVANARRSKSSLKHRLAAAAISLVSGDLFGTIAGYLTSPQSVALLKQPPTLMLPLESKYG